MEIAVTTDDFTLHAYEDVKAFSVISDLPAEQIADVLLERGWGKESDTPGHVYISVDSVRDAAHALGANEAWEGGFTSMLAYAGSKGWLDESGSMILAHVEPAPGTADASL